MDDDYEPEWDHHQEWKDNIAQGIHDEHGNPIDPEPPDEPTLAGLLAWTAEGTWNLEASVWLLDQHGHWLPELERLDLIGEHTGADGDTSTFIRWNRFPVPRLVGTGSELQVLGIAHALAAGGQPTSLGNLTSLDEENRRLVLHAVAWAMAGREWAESLHLTHPIDGIYYSDKSPF